MAKKKKKGWLQKRLPCAACGCKTHKPAGKIAGRSVCLDCIKLPLRLAVDAMRELAYIEGRVDAPGGDPFKK